MNNEKKLYDLQDKIIENIKKNYYRHHTTIRNI